MPRSPTTLDAFNAIAEPRRREVLDLLADREWPVNDIVSRLGWPQPAVSKHLKVLREVGLVDVRRDGRRQIYTLNANRLRPIHDWVKNYERFWSHHLERIKAAAEAKAKTVNGPVKPPSKNRSESHGHDC